MLFSYCDNRRHFFYNTREHNMIYYFYVNIFAVQLKPVLTLRLS